MNIAALSIMDFSFLFVVIISFLAAVHSGFLATSLGLTRTLLASYGAIALGALVQPMIITIIPSVFLGRAVASMVLFIALCIILSITKTALLTAMGPVTKGIFDRSLGAFFGFFRGLLICSIVFLGIALGCSGLSLERNHAGFLEVTYHSERFPDLLASSQSTTLLKMSSKILLSALPRSLLEELFILNQTIRSKFSTGLEEAMMPSAMPPAREESVPMKTRAVTVSPAAERSQDAVESPPTQPAPTSDSGGGISDNIQQLKSLMGDVLKGTMQAGS